MRTGYYIFFGNGDYHPSTYKTKEWVSEWNLDDWKKFIDEIIELDSNTLLIYLNGHTLPYRSKSHPELVDTSHLNCNSEFLSELLLYAKGKGLKIIAVLTTTGHAGKFAELNESSKIEVLLNDLSIEDTLVPFPAHIRKGKMTKKEGAAQVGYGVLCHNKEISRAYAKDILAEVIHTFGDIIDGIALHPPESAYPCGCTQCKDKYFIRYKESLNPNNIENHREFFIKSYLEFQSELHSLISKELPQCQQATFTIPWLYENSFDIVGQLIPKDVIIIEWDYNLEPSRISSIKKRIEKYMSLGHTIWFMPTGGFSFNPLEPADDQINLLYQQIEAVEDMTIGGIIHFLGPRKSTFMTETSLQKFFESKQETICKFN
ncbi:hypothetical protein Lrub_1007 [Legionella rubrilucens]|uniref:Uncharacterized protein n=1 Tax=Legionella rubrilucens TaxID=458 RepID=A0A0W0XWB8_9GAMM|nr:hypothetical protein [Legionella rubrilucens]KTD48656.1 hypothetical protein Lrub_1007 [Legionella rubrilucens]